MTQLVTKPVTKARWREFEALFESRGAPSYCWCMPFRPIENRTDATNDDRKQALEGFVERGIPIGLVGYLDGAPVAWCSVAPRSSFVALSKDQDTSEDGVWSVTCFFVLRSHRKQGLSARMLDAAIAHVRKRGARMLESYPVDPDSPSYRFMGFVGLFESRGFSETGRLGSRRHVMRLVL